MFLNVVHVHDAKKEEMVSLGNKEERNIFAGSVYDCSLKKNIHMITALTVNCLSVNILQTFFHILLNIMLNYIQEENILQISHQALQFGDTRLQKVS